MGINSKTSNFNYIYHKKKIKMKSFILLLSICFATSLFAENVESKMIQKEITIISDCEIVSLLGNSIELKTVIDLDVHPKIGDSAQAIINSIYTDEKGYRALDTKTFSLVFLESLKSDTKLIKHFTLSGDINYIKSKYKVGESIPLQWKTTTEVEHYTERDLNGNIKSEGYYIDGLPVGEEKLINKDGHLVVSSTSIGYYHGTSTEYDNGIKIMETNWFMGEKFGPLTEWYLNGKIKSKTYYIDDTAEGLNELFYENGQLLQKRYFYGGKKHGQDYYYYENGNLEDDAHYKNGEFHGLCTKYYENGNIKFQAYYNHNVVDGDYIRNYESGKKEVKTSFIKGKLNGSYIDFYENGKKKSKGNYLNGDKIGKWVYWDKNGKKTVKKFN